MIWTKLKHSFIIFAPFCWITLQVDVKRSIIKKGIPSLNLWWSRGECSRPWSSPMIHKTAAHTYVQLWRLTCLLPLSLQYRKKKMYTKQKVRNIRPCTTVEADWKALISRGRTPVSASLVPTAPRWGKTIQWRLSLLSFSVILAQLCIHLPAVVVRGPGEGRDW